MSDFILNIETATKSCSVSLFNGEQLVGFKEHISKEFSHSEMLTGYIEDLLKDSDILFSQLVAIAVSMGPGSFTGLRIGVATAKGLCYALKIPLISVSTLQAMAFGVAIFFKADLYCPMIDARRMEVYSAFYDIKNKLIREIRADVVDPTSYDKLLSVPIVFFGDGAEKLKNVIVHDNARFLDDVHPSAKNLGVLAYKKFIKNDFENIAYFEPYYLKDFVSNKKD